MIKGGTLLVVKNVSIPFFLDAITVADLAAIVRVAYLLLLIGFLFVPKDCLEVWSLTILQSIPRELGSGPTAGNLLFQINGDGKLLTQRQRPIV